MTFSIDVHCDFECHDNSLFWAIIFFLASKSLTLRILYFFGAIISPSLMSYINDHANILMFVFHLTFDS